jgi:hypothetical protein
VDYKKKRRRLDLIAEKLVLKAMAGDNWCIGQVADRFDGKPTSHTEGTMDHAIRIVWAGMPALEAEPAEQIENAESVAALPAPQPEVELERENWVTNDGRQLLPEEPEKAMADGVRPAR